MSPESVTYLRRLIERAGGGVEVAGEEKRRYGGGRAVYISTGGRGFSQ
jgi:hypothetical protein